MDASPAPWHSTEDEISVSTTYLTLSRRKGFRLLFLLIALESYSFFLPASPKVRLSLANEALPPTLICNIAGYYPLDVTVTWTREELGGAPVPVSDASFSSLRQSPAGTYSISSSLTVEPGSAGATYTCQVTHVSLDEPLRVSIWASPPGTGVPSSPHLHPGLVALLPSSHLWSCSASQLLLFQGGSLHSCHHTSQDFGKPQVPGHQAVC